MIKTPLKLGKYTIHHRSLLSGKKPPLLLIHGLGVSGAYYLPLAKLLAKSHDVHIIDLPGYGETPKPATPLTILQLSDIVLDFITHENLHDVTIVGQSMGCQIISHAAAKQSRTFRKMILLAPTVNCHERSLFKQSLRLLQDSFHEPLSATLLVFRDYVRMGLRRYIATSCDMISDDIEQTLSTCTVPTLIVRGGNDKIVPHNWALRLSSSYPAAELAEIPHAPHLLHYQRPTELATLCQQFIEK